MNYFPQLSTGALVQLPFAVRRSTRTIFNEAADGSLDVLADAKVARTTWLLHYEGLSDAEATALADLFRVVQGRRQTFVFLDPCSNLLQWSEDLAASAWLCDPMVAVSTAGNAAWLGGGVFSLTNVGQTWQGISQVVPAPGDLHYAFSFYARAAAAVEFKTERRNGAAESTSFRTREAWQRFCSAGKIAGGGDEIRFSLSMPAGASMEVCGLQVEAQPAASAYKPTYSEGGVYSAARFADDSLSITTNGPNNHSTNIRVTTRSRRD